MAKEEYTMIFHPSGRRRVTVHKHGTVSIIATKPTVLQQGCKLRGAKLWTTSADDQSKHQSVNKVYILPSIQQTVWYLHGATGFSTKETWVKAINASNFNTWPTLTPSTVRRHFPESDETQTSVTRVRWFNKFLGAAVEWSKNESCARDSNVISAVCENTENKCYMQKQNSQCISNPAGRGITFSIKQVYEHFF